MHKLPVHRGKMANYMVYISFMLIDSETFYHCNYQNHKLKTKYKNHHYKFLIYRKKKAQQSSLLENNNRKIKKRDHNNRLSNSTWQSGLPSVSNLKLRSNKIDQWLSQRGNFDQFKISKQHMTQNYLIMDEIASHYSIISSKQHHIIKSFYSINY